MTSEKQIAANRRNAQKSTGPVTPEGKAVSSRNAITHGLYACDNVVNSPHLKEDQAEYDQLLASLVDELKPEGVLQEFLVCKIANSLWRSRRAINAETARIAKQVDDTARHLTRFDPLDLLDDDEDDESPDDIDLMALPPYASRIGSQSVPEGDFGLNLIRYEMRLDKQLSRSFRLLQHLQLMSEAKRLREDYSDK